jgi:hypothetical protein
MRTWLFVVLALCAVAEARPGKPVAFWISGMNKGPTRAAAIHRCVRRNPGGAAWCHERVIAVRGPYHRTHLTGDPDDDVKLYVYKGDDGIWYDRDGDTPGCDPSGCP